MYIMIKKTLTERIEAKARKNLYSNLIDILDIYLIRKDNTMSKVKQYYWDEAEKEVDDIYLN